MPRRGSQLRARLGEDQYRPPRRSRRRYRADQDGPRPTESEYPSEPSLRDPQPRTRLRDQSVLCRRPSLFRSAASRRSAARRSELVRDRRDNAHVILGGGTSAAHRTVGAAGAASAFFGRHRSRAQGTCHRFGELAGYVRGAGLGGCGVHTAGRTSIISVARLHCGCGRGKGR